MTDSIIPLVPGPKVLTRQSKAPEKEGDIDAGTLGFLCFVVGTQEFGIDLNLICQIVKPPPLTWVPRLAPHILGIISIRGAVVTLVDLRQLMDLEPTPWPKTSRVLIVEMDDEQVGLLVDSVTQVRRVEATALETRPSFVEGASEDYVSCVARPEDSQPVFMLDLDAILSERMK